MQAETPNQGFALKNPDGGAGIIRPQKMECSNVRITEIEKLVNSASDTKSCFIDEWDVGMITGVRADGSEFVLLHTGKGGDWFALEGQTGLHEWLKASNAGTIRHAALIA